MKKLTHSTHFDDLGQRQKGRFCGKHLQQAAVDFFDHVTQGHRKRCEWRIAILITEKDKGKMILMNGLEVIMERSDFTPMQLGYHDQEPLTTSSAICMESN